VIYVIVEVHVRSILVAVVLLAVSAPLPAQRPRVSPHETHEFSVDGSKISIEYGRPSKRGRVIWGGLVPWGKWWMPGADETTTLRTSEPMLVGNLAVPAGEHTIYMLPDRDMSKLIVNNRTGTFHTFYDQRSDLGRVDFPWRPLSEPVEQMTFVIEPREAGGGTLKLMWDDREYFVSVTIKP
jgi:hypothetical protein